jgi:hypothetical protein
MGKSLIDRQQLSHQMGMQAIKKQTGKYDLGLLIELITTFPT